jgi:sialate O-acetylesterase
MNLMIPRISRNSAGSRIKTAIISALVLVASFAHADVRLPALFSDHMVLQQGQPVPVWGWSDPGESITVGLAGQTQAAVADSQGNWRVSFAALKPGPPLTMTVTGKNTMTVQDIAVGEVWVASGQSNMQYRLSWDRVYNAPDIAASNNPQIRMFTVPSRGSENPEKDVKAAWIEANPKTVLDFSAVAYYYALNLQKALHVPVGIIQTSFGGTQGESWVSKEALATDPYLQQLADSQITAMQQMPGLAAAFPAAIDAWIAAHQQVDAGNSGVTQGWAKPDFDDSGWRTVQTQRPLSTYGLNGGAVVWYRKPVDLSASAGDMDFNLDCNWLNGVPTVYFNGTELKEIGTPHVRWAAAQHKYLVPKGIIQAGKSNVIAVREYSVNPHDTFGQTTRNMGLPVDDRNALTNDWKFNVEQQFPALMKEDLATLPVYPSANPQNTATYLFNAMINPLIPFGIKGVIWYQGESNVPRALTYEPLLTLLIKDWRRRWNEGDFPFYIVQLANYDMPVVDPVQDRIGNYNIREAQLKVSQSVPNTGLAVAIDIGEETIHPRNKREVGRRLSLLALNRVYGQKQVDSGPIYSGMTVKDDKVYLHFTRTDGGLVAKGGDLKQFSIAGSDRHFVWADAVIDGNSVVVSSPAVPLPVAVRYAWAGNPAGCNLYNGAGLPASPFRTDDWNPPAPPATAAR